MKRHNLSKVLGLVVFTGFSLALPTIGIAAEGTILDDPNMVPGTSILSDPVPLCGEQEMASYEAGVDVYGRPVVPADTTQPIAVSGASDVIQPEIYNPAKGTERIRMQLELKGLSAAMTPGPCQPAPKARRH